MSECTCKSCGETWTQDNDGLIPEFAIRSPRFYGYWKRIKGKVFNEDCPSCNDGNWTFVEVDKNVG